MTGEWSLLLDRLVAQGQGHSDWITLTPPPPPPALSKTVTHTVMHTLIIIVCIRGILMYLIQVIDTGTTSHYWWCVVCLGVFDGTVTVVNVERGKTKLLLSVVNHTNVGQGQVKLHIKWNSHTVSAGWGQERSVRWKCICVKAMFLMCTFKNNKICLSYAFIVITHFWIACCTV